MIKKGFDYTHYVDDRDFLTEYDAYQQKYITTVRESDLVLIEVVAQFLRERFGGENRLLDIGCSTGNLLRHLKRLLPELRLAGGDLAQSSLERCQSDPELAGVSFEKLNILDLPSANLFDIVTINAVLYMMDDDQFGQALSNVGRIVRPDGLIVVFDMFHPFEQHISMIETSQSHLDGLRITFRPFTQAIAACEKAGLAVPMFRPFTLPIDLPKPEAADDMTTYTISASDGRRLPFRGTLFQPWCHMTTRKL